MILSSLSSLAFPYIMKIIIDTVFPQKDFNLLVKIIFILLGINIFQIVISFASTYLYNWVSNHIILDMRRGLFNHLIHLPLSFFNNQKTGDIVHRINNEVDVIQAAITASALRFVHNTLTVIGLTVALCWLNWQLFLITIIVLPFLFLNVKYFQPKIRKITLLARKKYSDILSFFVERFENIKLILSYNRQKYENIKLTDKINEIIGINMKNVVLSASTGSISSFLMSLTPIIIFGWGGRQVILGIMTLGSLVAFLQYLSRIFDPFRDLMSLYIDLVRASVSMKRVFEFLDIPVQSRGDEHIKHFPFEKKIKFDNVDFGYNGNLVLNNFCLEFEKGKKIALVGPSGCGKSTVINLLCRFYEPDQGLILTDDISFQDIDLFELRKHIGLVTQDNYLFHESVWENIRYGKLESKPEIINYVAQRVDIPNDLLNQIEEDCKQGVQGKCNTCSSNCSQGQSAIGDHGVKLSGGQKQRIAIARALLKNADILIMDEATSALDSESEKKIFDNLQHDYQDKTMIFISHRLSAIKNVDEIICMDNGRVVETGTYKELIARKGYYWKLFKDQVE